jgi:hypothetical protein
MEGNFTILIKVINELSKVDFLGYRLWDGCWHGKGSLRSALGVTITEGEEKGRKQD